MTKNKQSDLIASVKMLYIGVINKYTINLIGIRGGGGGSHLASVNHQSFLSNLFSLAPQLFFSISCGRNRLLHVSFITVL